MVSKPTEEQKVILEAQFKKKHEKKEEVEETIEETFQMHSEHDRGFMSCNGEA